MLFQLAFTAAIMKAPVIKLRDVQKKQGILMSSGTLSNPAPAGGNWNVFLDCEDCVITADGLGHMLEDLEFPADLKMAGGTDFVDGLYFPIMTSACGRAMLPPGVGEGRRRLLRR
jgi:hypothetical protein